MTFAANDGLCKLTRGWFCRDVWWRLERVTDRPGLQSIHDKIEQLDREIHPERYTTDDRAKWEHDHMRHGH